VKIGYMSSGYLYATCEMVEFSFPSINDHYYDDV